ncbi:hypothetical protein RB195_004898 [Necator americanus]|uniref:RUN domain-containing protein n=1 Tax=Necator americanus TaxID=51031 RepID=A0ABR1BK87_NECAM
MFVPLSVNAAPENNPFPFNISSQNQLNADADPLVSQNSVSIRSALDDGRKTVSRTGFHQLIEMVIDEKYYVFHQLLRSQRVGENGTEPNSRESLLEHVASKIDLVLRNVVLHDGFVSG